ncbi:MAG: hypothetical protein ACK5Q5_11915 [Planctomycetaceae bacterium]
MARWSLVLALLILTTGPAAARCLAADNHSLISWQKQQLSDLFFSVGADSGDFNIDGRMDIVS